VPFGEQAKQRLAGDLATASHTAMSMVPTATSARHGRPAFSFDIIVAQILSGIEIIAGGVTQRFRISFQQARREALRISPPCPVRPLELNAVADHAPAVAHHVGDDGD
jgi:hypothetical protein